MPRTSIAQENVRNDSTDRFPRLKLETNEVAIFCLFQPPWMEWVHELRAIKIEGGVAKKETKTRRDKSTYEDYEYEFVGRPVCLGDSSILANEGSDKTNCPACRDGNTPTQRYAANIIRYALNGQGDPRDPFGADILVWSFTARMFGELFQLQKGAQGGDLSMVDLRLVCEDGFWQRNKLYIHGQQAWCREEKNFGNVSALLQTPGNLATDDQLAEACGRRRTRDQIQLDLDRIAGAARQAAQAGNQGSLTDNLNGIMPQAGQQTGWGGLPQQAPQQVPQQAQMASAPSQGSDPFAALNSQQAAPQGVQGPVPGARPQEEANPGVGGMGEFGPVTPVPEGQDQAVASQASSMFPEGQTDPFASAATSTPTAAPAAAPPSATAQSAVPVASEAVPAAASGSNWSFADITGQGKQ